MKKKKPLVETIELDVRNYFNSSQWTYRDFPKKCYNFKEGAMDNLDSYEISQIAEIMDSQTRNYSFEKDFDFIKKHAGNKDPEFLQFLLKCEMDNPRRLETVMCDNLHIPNAAELIREFRTNSVSPTTSKHSIDDPLENCSENKKRKTESGKSYLNSILEIFPDADENFLLQECKSLESWEDYSRFLNTVMISGMYPKKGANYQQSDNEKIVDISNAYDIDANQTLDSEISFLWEKDKNEELYIIESPKKAESNINDIVEIESVSNYEQAGKSNANNEIDITSDIIHDSFSEIQGDASFNEAIKNFNRNCKLRRSSAMERGSRGLKNFDYEKSLAEIIEESRRSRRSLDSQRDESIRKYLTARTKSPNTSTTPLHSPLRNVDDYVGRNSNKTDSPNFSESDLGEDVEFSSKVSEDWLNEQTANLMRIFPQTDPSYLREEVLKMNGSSEAMNAFVIEKLEKNNMPTKADFEKKREMEELQNKYTKNFSIEQFLKAIPEPWKYFKDGNRNCVRYKTHSLCYLKSAFRKHYVRDIIDVFKKNNHNLYVSFKCLANTESRKRGSRRSEFECNIDRPTIIDIQFLQEVAFIENEAKIKKFIENAKQTKLLKFEEAKRNGSLLECQCCFDSEVMVEDVVYCPKDHSFCKNCVTRSVEIEMGNGKCQFECLTNCEEKFTLTCLQNVLSPELFSKVIQAVQIEEIKAAEIEDLVQCPFCNYATIMPPEEKVMVCLNPECLKESCRLCKEINHIPLRCDEVEKSDEIKIRTYIENKMTEALIRTCYKCNKKFVKEDGCNKMTCTCGAKMCYVCRKPVTDYTHFNGQGGTEYHKCPLYSTNDELHVDLVTQIGMEAKAEILEANPEGRLLHDPTLILPQRTHETKAPGVNNGMALNFGLRALRETKTPTKVRPKSTHEDDEVQEIGAWEPQNPNGEGNNCCLRHPNQGGHHHDCHNNRHRLQAHNHLRDYYELIRHHQHHRHHHHHHHHHHH